MEVIKKTVIDSIEYKEDFINEMVSMGYASSAAQQLWLEANLNGSYGIFIAGVNAGKKE